MTPLDIVMVEKVDRKVAVMDVAVPNGSNIRKKKHEKWEEYPGLREKWERMCGGETPVVPVVIGALGAMTPKAPAESRSSI